VVQGPQGSHGRHGRHRQPERATLFDREAERYDRSRPRYPDELFDAVLGPAPRGLSVLDVACGTGIASRSMAQRGAEVLGVELSPRMAEVARRSGIPVEVAAFESWDPAGRTFDRVTCGQAWHWLEPDASLGKAVAVLRPGGRLCLFWSIGHHPDDLGDALRTTYERVLPADGSAFVVGYGADSATDARSDLDTARALTDSPELDEPQTAWFPWNRRYTRDEWLDELQTHSDHMAMPPEVRRRVLDEVGATIDRFGGTFDMAYATFLVSATRRRASVDE
jgi:SAM-dependent methyltransferase